jgi:hypothetical protein
MSRAVIDQPGLRIVVIGLALSFFLGLALRSQISDSRIQTYLDKAVSRLQSDFHVDYEHAKVNLSKWGLPFPVLEIQRIRLSPKSSVCQSSQVYIDELEVPISISVLLGLTDKIPRIRLQEVELRFSDSSEKCIFQPKPVEVAVPAGAPAQADAGRANAVFSKSTRAELKDIYIEQLRLIYAKKPEQPVLLRQINVELKYAERRLSELSLKSKLYAIKDTRSDFYFINANLLVTVKAKSANDIDTVVSVEGKLLDGDIRLFAHNVSGEQKVAFELSVDKVSGKALHPFIETDRQFKIAALDRIPISFSFVNAGELYMGNELGLDTHFKKVLVNIENGQVRASEVKLVVQNDSWIFSPFTVEIDGLPLSKLKQSDRLRGRLDSFESLGVLTGKLIFKDEHHYQFDGVLRNVETVFSNRGRRDLQNIDELQLQLAREEQNVLLNAKNFVVNGKQLVSSFNFRHNLADYSTTGIFKISGLGLSSKIWEQFTFVEQSPLVDFTWNYKKAAAEVHTVHLVADQIEIPGFIFENISLDLSQVNSQNSENSLLHVNVLPRKVLSTPRLLENEYVSRLVSESIRVKNPVFSSDKTTISLSGRDWRNMNFDLQSTLTDLETKTPTTVSFKGSTSVHTGLNSKITITQKSSTSIFDFLTTPDSRLVLKSRQQ